MDGSMNKSQDITIREATPADAHAIIDILNPIIEAGTYTALDTPFTVEAERLKGTRRFSPLFVPTTRLRFRHILDKGFRSLGPRKDRPRLMDATLTRS
jgi:hypothetical protein